MPEILNKQDITLFLRQAQALAHPWYPIWATALLTGMRSGELHALTWDNVDLENRRVFVKVSFDVATNSVKCTKGSYWREVPINAPLYDLLSQLKLNSYDGNHVLPRFTDWDRGEQARILRAFLGSIGIMPVKFHTLRACFATQLLREKVAPAIVMKIAGWKDLKTMQRYVRLAGIEIEGATDVLTFPTPSEAMGKVVNLFGDQPESLH